MSAEIVFSLFGKPRPATAVGLGEGFAEVVFEIVFDLLVEGICSGLDLWG
jgi:hypothetical protein